MGIVNTEEMAGIRCDNETICAECVDALCGKEWILFYCLKCNSSQWVKRALARKSYPANMNIMFYDECPNCFEVI